MRFLLPLLILVGVALAVPQVSVGDPAGDELPRDLSRQLLVTAARHLGLEPEKCVLVFAVKRVSVMPVERGYAVALYEPEAMVTAAVLIGPDGRTLDGISYLYSYSRCEADLVGMAARREKDFGLSTNDERYLLIGAHKTGEGWLVITLWGWNHVTDDWGRRVFENVIKPCRSESADRD